MYVCMYVGVGGLGTRAHGLRNSCVTWGVELRSLSSVCLSVRRIQVIFPFSWARNFARCDRTEVNSGSFPPTANLNVVQIRSRPKHLPLAEKTTVARRYGVSKLWELCLHFMTGMVQNRGGPQMFLGAKAFCRKGSPPAKKWIQQVDKNVSNLPSARHRKKPQKRTFVPSKAVQSLF